MDQDTPFEDLLRQVRAGDESAAAELVRRYEPYIRRAARTRLRSAGLRRVLDSMDVCQSVLASLFNRAAQGQYDLATADQLQKLLVRMVRNKVTDAWRRNSVRIVGVDGLDLNREPAASPEVDESIIQRELIELATQRFSPDEFALFAARNEGWEWSVIADRQGSSPEALRKKLARAIDRVSRELTTESE